MPSAATSKLRRAVRIIVRCLAGLAVLLIIVVAALLYVLSHLETPAVKTRILALAAEQGISLDYEEAGVSLSALHFSKLRIAQPPPDETLEPLFAIDRIDLAYSPWMVLLGGSFKLQSGVIQGVRGIIFADENGESSITRLLARMPKSAPKKASKPSPLSETLAGLSNLKVKISDFKLDQVSAKLIERASGKEIKRSEFSGLELSVTDPAGALDLKLGTPDAGALVRMTEGATARELLADVHLELIWSVRGANPHGALEMDAKLRHQDLIALPPQAPRVQTLLSLHAGITPEPAKQRTRIVVESLDLLEGAGSGHLDAEMVDDSSGGVKPSIKEAVFDLVLERFRPFIPTSTGEISVLSGNMQLRAFGIDLSRGLRVSPDGGADIRADIPQLKWRQGKLLAEVTRAKLSLHAKPASGGAAIELEMPIEAVRFNNAAQSISLAHAEVKSKLDATLAYHATGSLTARLESLSVGGKQAIQLADAEFRVSLKDADLAAEGPLKISGGVASELDLGKLSAKADGLAIDLSQLSLRAPMQFAKSAASGAGELHLAAQQLSAKQGGRTLLAPADVSADLSLPKFSFDEKDPIRSTADATFAFALGAISAQLHLDKKARDLDYDLSAKAASLGLLRSMVSVQDTAGVDRIPFAQIGFSLSSKGNVTNLGGGNALKIAQDTTVTITRGALHGDGLDLAFATLGATLRSHGTPMHHEADLSLQMSGLSVQNEAREGEENITLHALIDREQSSAQLQFESKGEAAPEGKLNFSFGFDRTLAKSSYAIDGELHQLDLIPLLLPPALLAHTDLEWEQLALTLQGKGEMTGVVTDMRDFKPKLAANPLKTVRGAQTFDLTLTGLDYSNDNDQSLVLASAAIHLDAREEDGGKHLEFTASAPGGEIDAANVQAKFEALTSALTVDLGPASLRAQMHLGFGSLKQDAQPAYPIGDASLDALITAGADGTIHIEQAKLDNVAGGTALSATGVVEAMLVFTDGAPTLRPVPTGVDAEQRDLKLTGDLIQRLEAVPQAAGFTGRGLMRVPFAAESNDFRYFRVVTGLEFKDADLDLPARQISLGKLNAKIPVRLNFRLDDAGALPLGGARPGVYSRERFVDYQPFLGSEDFISCETLKFGDSVVGPLAANLRVDRNVIALDQLEMSAFGGKITGQFLLDLDMAQRELTDVQFRGNVTGLAPGHGEERSTDVVDANAALRLNPKKLELEGRIDIIRIGRDDLRAMLDAWDPSHSNASANRTRKALLAGYPKDVRLGFHQGFTELRMEMGGLAGVSSLEPIQLSTGPILQQYVAPYLKMMKPKPSAAQTLPQGTP